MNKIWTKPCKGCGVRIPATWGDDEHACKPRGIKMEYESHIIQII